MILLERIGLAATVLEAVLMSHFPTILASTVSGAGRGGKAPCQYRKYARSGGVADAVREHSFCSSPTRSGSAVLERVAPLFFVRLTPARWQAKSLAGQFSARYGCGAAVPAEPIQNQRQNRQVTEIVSQSSQVLWFRSIASRDARVCMHTGPCAYMCARNSRTSEPLHYISILQLVSGSSLGSARFSPEPALLAAGRGHANPPISNILCGRYGSAMLDRSPRGLMRSRVGESFGVFGLGAAPDRGRCASSTRRGRNGGKPPFFEGAAGRVGTSLLERGAETRGNARFSVPDHLPSGKARSTPPCPLSRSQPPSWRWRSSVARFGSAFARTSISATAQPSKNRREVDFARRGRGKRRGAGNPAIKPGRGLRDAAERLRRTPCMGGGASHVN